VPCFQAPQCTRFHDISFSPGMSEFSEITAAAGLADIVRIDSKSHIAPSLTQITDKLSLSIEVDGSKFPRFLLLASRRCLSVAEAFCTPHSYRTSPNYGTVQCLITIKRPRK